MKKYQGTKFKKIKIKAKIKIKTNRNQINEVKQKSNDEIK